MTNVEKQHHHIKIAKQRQRKTILSKYLCRPQPNGFKNNIVFAFMLCIFNCLWLFFFLHIKSSSRKHVHYKVYIRNKLTSYTAVKNVYCFIHLEPTYSPLRYKMQPWSYEFTCFVESIYLWFTDFSFFFLFVCHVAIGAKIFFFLSFFFLNISYNTRFTTSPDLWFPLALM